MKKRFALSVAMVLGLSGLASAEDMKSGLQTGDSLPAFEVTKCAGAESEGIENGSELCYRCRMGNRPVIMVFTRTTDGNLAKLVKGLDEAVSKNSDKKLASFVNLLGKDEAALQKQAAKFVTNNNLAHVAFVVPKEQPNGPADYKLSDKAEITVLIYRDGKVAVNHTFAAGGLDDGAIKQVISDTAKILN